MKIISKVLLVAITLSCLSCNKLKYSNLKIIEIYDYQLEVPSKFEQIIEQGIDSYVGKIVGEGIELQYDYGRYTGPDKNLDPDKFDEHIKTFGSVERQIVVAKDPDKDFTTMHISDTANVPDIGNISLKLYTNNISRKQQKLVVKIMESAMLKE